MIHNACNEGFAFACNQGIACSQGKYICLLNNDAEVTEGWLEPLLALIEAGPQMGAVAPCTNRASGVQALPFAPGLETGGPAALARLLHQSQKGAYQLVERVVGLCLLLSRSAIHTIGGLDPIFGFGNCEDDDYCLRLRRHGYGIGVSFESFVYHHGSQTFSHAGLQARTLARQNWRLFCWKWGLDPETTRPDDLSNIQSTDRTFNDNDEKSETDDTFVPLQSHHAPPASSEPTAPKRPVQTSDQKSDKDTNTRLQP